MERKRPYVARKPVEQKKSDTLLVRITEWERKRYEREAKGAGMTLSAWVRLTLNHVQLGSC